MIVAIDIIRDRHKISLIVLTEFERITRFFISNAFFNSALVLLDNFMAWASNVA